MRGRALAPPHPRPDPQLPLSAPQRGDADGAPHVVVVGTVARAVLPELAPVDEPVAVDDELRAGRAHEVVLAAHQDRLLGAGVHAEAAVHAAEEVDLEPSAVLLD